MFRPSDKFTEQLKRHEGFYPAPYLDTVGVVTIGYGTNLEAHPKYIVVLVADAFEQAAAFLEAVKVEMESNPRLASDFPGHCGAGRVWNVGAIVTAQNIKIQAFGAGKRMRGLRHGPHRPDLALLDDLENDENVRKPEQRDKLETWLLRAVLSLGAADGSMDVIYVGTILHYDSVLSRMLKKPQWMGKSFRALISMPDRMDLWDNWEVLLKVGGPDRARAFYDKNRKAMDAGARVSWPSFRPLYSLMLKRAEDRAAFDAEQQNDPLAADAAPFAECIAYWTEPPQGLLLFVACNPSLGKAGQGRDPSALLIGGYDRAATTLYVIEALIRKRQWELKDDYGRTVAHAAARGGHLPPGFGQWDLRDNAGVTVAHEEACYGRLPLPDVATTKNHAERLLRFPVIWRKRS
jgi:hypothetical protein